MCVAERKKNGHRKPLAPRHANLLLSCMLVLRATIAKIQIIFTEFNFLQRIGAKLIFQYTSPVIDKLDHPQFFT